VSKSGNGYAHFIQHSSNAVLFAVNYNVTTYLENLENLEMSGNLTAVREMSGILVKIREIFFISSFGIYGVAVVPDSGVGNTWQERLAIILKQGF